MKIYFPSCSQAGALVMHAVISQWTRKLFLISHIIFLLIATVLNFGRTVSKETILLYLCSFRGCFPLTCFFSQSYEHLNGTKFSFNLSVDDVSNVASSLVSEVSSVASH